MQQNYCCSLHGSSWTDLAHLIFMRVISQENDSALVVAVNFGLCSENSCVKCFCVLAQSAVVVTSAGCLLQNTFISLNNCCGLFCNLIYVSSCRRGAPRASWRCIRASSPIGSALDRGTLSYPSSFPALYTRFHTLFSRLEKAVMDWTKQSNLSRSPLVGKFSLKL